MNNKNIIIIAKPKVGSLQLHVATDSTIFLHWTKIQGHLVLSTELITYIDHRK